MKKNGKPEIGFHYYTTDTCEASDGTEIKDLVADQQTAGNEPGIYKGYKNPHLGTTAFGWEIDCIGFRSTLRELYLRYHLLLLVTENEISN